MGDDQKQPAPEPWPQNAAPKTKPTGESAPATPTAPVASTPPAPAPSVETRVPQTGVPETPATEAAATESPAAAPAPQPVITPSLPLDPNAPRALKDRVLDVLGTIYDPEIPVNIYELGLIYELTVNEDDGSVIVRMTLTSPSCPVAGTLPGEVEEKIRGVEGVTSCDLALIWEPPWDKDRLSEAAKLQLGLL